MLKDGSGRVSRKKVSPLVVRPLRGGGEAGPSRNSFLSSKKGSEKTMNTKFEGGGGRNTSGGTFLRLP